MTEFATARRNMVEGQVRTADVTDLRILSAMLEIPARISCRLLRRVLHTSISIWRWGRQGRAGSSNRWYLRNWSTPQISSRAIGFWT